MLATAYQLPFWVEPLTSDGNLLSKNKVTLDNPNRIRCAAHQDPVAASVRLPAVQIDSQAHAVYALGLRTLARPRNSVDRSVRMRRGSGFKVTNRT